MHVNNFQKTLIMIQGAHWPPSEHIIKHFLFSFRETGFRHGLLCIGNHVSLILFSELENPLRIGPI